MWTKCAQDVWGTRSRYSSVPRRVGKTAFYNILPDFITKVVAYSVSDSYQHVPQLSLIIAQSHMKKTWINGYLHMSECFQD